MTTDRDGREQGMSTDRMSNGGVPRSEAEQLPTLRGSVGAIFFFRARRSLRRPRSRRPLRCGAAGQAQAGDKPNILVIFGDDIGLANISAYSHGLMGYRTPNIDRIASEGMMFIDYYAEQSCTAGRSTLHHRTGDAAHRAVQGRDHRRPRSGCRTAIRRSRNSSSRSATPPGSSARTTWATRTNTCRPCTGSTSSSATSTT